MNSETKVLQININRSLETTEHVLQLAIELNISILAIQEPWTIREDNNTYRSVNHSSFNQILPNYGSFRPRVLFYVNKRIVSSLAPNSPLDPDCMFLDIIVNKIQIINFYNAKHPNIDNSITTLERDGILPNLLNSNTILLGDFNIHHPWWDPYYTKPSPNSGLLVNYIESNSLSLLNIIGEGTFYRTNMERPSVLDLTFATQGIYNKIENWQVMPDLGSDHFGILFTITSSNTSIVNSSNSLSQDLRFNTKLANWDKFNSNLNTYFKEFPYNCNSVYTNQELDDLGELFTKNILNAANSSIPRVKHNSSFSKPWWNDNLKNLRKTMQKFYRLYKASEFTLYLQDLKNARNLYFNTIKIEKRKHWNKFLEKEDSQSIFKAMSYTKNKDNSTIIPSLYNIQTKELESTFHNKCNIFRNTLFPTPPITSLVNFSENNYNSNKEWKWPLLSKVELANSCNSKIKGKTPGPDFITQEIIVKAYLAIPDIFYIVYSIFINQGYHPKIWKQATGFILKKPKKPDYTIPKAYRVISLLNCLGKVSERILARRLSYLAETTNLLHNSQIGSRLKKSAIDVALLLKNEIELNKANKLKTTCLFLDVKGAFDHVAKNRLLQVLINLKLPISLIKWTSSFLEDRSLRLKFDNNIEEFKAINTGIPQGSPISPILFLIYTRDLFKSTNIKPISYVDDLVLIASSKTLKQNIRILEREYKNLIELGKEYIISFDIDKTDLIHFHGGKTTPSLTLPNKTILAPSKLVRWLGINFDSNLNFKEHRAIRTSLARQMFYRINRLSNTRNGLSPFAIRQLYLACVTSVLDYGSILWWSNTSSSKNNTTTKQFQAIQNLITRKLLGVFKTAPIIPMELESALAPPNIRLNHINRRYILRVLKLSNTHPIREEVNKLIPGIQDEILQNQDQNFNWKSNTQIEGLVKSIYNIVDLTSLETIKHYYFTPWDKEIPYLIKISKLSKEEEAKAHLAYLNSITLTNTTSIYTDGSQTPEGSGIGYGFAVYNHNSFLVPKTPVFINKGNLGNLELVYNGELEAVTKAIEYASSIAKEGDTFNIFSDNQAVILRLKTPSDNPGQNQQIRAILASKTINSRKASISIIWVPGHTDIIGNETADKLAKQATKLAPISNNTSFAMLGVKINQVRNLEIQAYIAINSKSSSLKTYASKFTCKVSKKLVIPRGITRELASSFYQLKLGHGYLKSYLYQLNLIPNNKCKCNSIETTIHLLLNCKDYKVQRDIRDKNIKEELSVNTIRLPILFETKIGIKHLLVFLKETNICTRNWREQRP